MEPLLASNSNPHTLLEMTVSFGETAMFVVEVLPGPSFEQLSYVRPRWIIDKLGEARGVPLELHIVGVRGLGIFCVFSC